MIASYEINRLKKTMRKLPKDITKNELIDWFLEKQRGNGYAQCTVIDLIMVAELAGKNVKR